MILSNSAIKDEFCEYLKQGSYFKNEFTSFEAFDTTSSFDSFDIWASYFLKNGLRIGAAYDYTLTELSQATSGSFELFLGYEFEYETKKTVTPRYF